MTSETLFDSHWFRVRSLTPRLAVDVRLHRHVYRGRPSYVLHRASTRRWHRLTDTIWEVVRHFDGACTVEEAWHAALKDLGEQAPGQADVMRLLSDLHDADLVTVNRKLDAEQLFGRNRRMRQLENRSKFLNPLFMRIRLFDPDPVVELLYPVCRWLFRPGFAYLLFALFALAFVTLVPRTAELGAYLNGEELLQADRLLVIALVYPLMKLLHELAHALTIKHYGGDVRDAGIALLVLLPNPWVDASASTAFADKGQRMRVSAAGMIAELTMATIACLVWAHADGLLREIAFAVMLIGGVSTLLFNGNPLLKFDAYYLLADWLEIPNLASRSRKYLLCLAAERIGAEPAERPAPVDRNEARWLIAYGLSATLYRIVLMLTIATVLSERFFLFGLLLSAWILYTLVLAPLVSAIRFLATQRRSVRLRGALIGGAITTVFATAATAMPLPNAILTEAIVWLPDNAVLHIEHDCEVRTVYAEPGSTVLVGQPLFNCTDPELDARIETLDARIEELVAKRAGLAATEPVEHRLLGIDLDALLENRTRELRLQQSLNPLALTEGRFLIDGTTDLPGRFLAAGSVAGFVVPEHQRTVRLALRQDQIGWLDDDEDPSLEIRLSDPSLDRGSWPTEIRRRTPQATVRLPSAALTSAGGGMLKASSSGDGREVIAPVFDLELLWPDGAPVQPVGARVLVRIAGSPQPVAVRLIDRFRRAVASRSQS